MIRNTEISSRPISLSKFSNNPSDSKFRTNKTRSVIISKLLANPREVRVFKGDELYSLDYSLVEGHSQRVISCANKLCFRLVGDDVCWST